MSPRRNLLLVLVLFTCVAAVLLVAGFKALYSCSSKGQTSSSLWAAPPVHSSTPAADVAAAGQTAAKAGGDAGMEAGSDEEPTEDAQTESALEKDFLKGSAASSSAKVSFANLDEDPFEKWLVGFPAKPLFRIDSSPKRHASPSP